jgi:hypothetical protein
VLAHADGTLRQHRSSLGAAITGIMRQFDPDTVITFGADGGYGHPDHVAISELTTEAYRALVRDNHRGQRLYHAAFPPRRTVMAEELAHWIINSGQQAADHAALQAITLFAGESATMGLARDDVRVEWFPPGTYVVEQGEPANALYLILDGIADALLEHPDGQVIPVLRNGRARTASDALRLPDVRGIAAGAPRSSASSRARSRSWSTRLTRAVPRWWSPTSCRAPGQHGRDPEPGRRLRPGTAGCAATPGHRPAGGTFRPRGADGSPARGPCRGDRARRRQLVAVGHLPPAAGDDLALAGPYPCGADLGERDSGGLGELGRAGRAAAGRRCARPCGRTGFNSTGVGLPRPGDPLPTGLTVPDGPRVAFKGAGQVARDAASGFAELARVAPPAGVGILIFAQTVVRGALVVLIPVLAVQTLVLGQSAVGWLTAAIGAGGLVGGAAAAGLVHVTRLGRAFVAGLLVRGLPLACLALTPSEAVAYLALVVVGIGNAVENVGGFTLIARAAGPRSAGRSARRDRVRGSGRAGRRSRRRTCAPVRPRRSRHAGPAGRRPDVLALAHVRRFVRLDQAMPDPGQEVELLRRLAMFAPLPLAVRPELRRPPGPVAAPDAPRRRRRCRSRTCRAAAHRPPGRRHPPLQVAATRVRYTAAASLMSVPE